MARPRPPKELVDEVTKRIQADMELNMAQHSKSKFGFKNCKTCKGKKHGYFKKRKFIPAALYALSPNQRRGLTNKYIQCPDCDGKGLIR